MKLELKHLAAYLPYSVRTNIGRYSETNVELDLGFLISYEIHAFKLILRPLSDLTKEIEANGEKIVPIIYILKNISLFDLSDCNFEYEDYNEKDGCYINAVLNGRVIDSITFDGNMFRCMNNDGSFDFYNPQHEALDLLSKLHFDWKYRLIDNDLAIDINTLK